MTPEDFAARILAPGLVDLRDLGGPPPSLQAERFLLAVALQESMLRHRAQVLSGGKAGPARGWWQFEAGGGVAGVMAHRRTSALVAKACAWYEIQCQRDAIWRAIEGHDGMATVMARLLLWTDAYAIPASESAGWNCYAHRLWRPGRPHPATWPGYWHTASEVCGLPT